MLAIGAAACSPAPLDALAPGERGRVTAASGGVLEIGGERVRLAGVELAPETDEALRDWAVGREAELLYGGARRDAYGRTLAQVRLTEGRVWVQGRLLDAGLARVRTWSDNRALAGEMLRREARARVAGRGAWAGEGWRVLTADEAERARGFALVEGRVRRVEQRGRSLYLDFGADPRDDFSVRVPAEALEAFAAAGVAADALGGRLVRVRGAVRESRYGPVMTVDHPEAVELLRE
jgi:endonuclease YncB( thermonuclease family)